MVVLAAAVSTKSGKSLISRQFRPLPKSRVDSLLASFPKLISSESQHTTVETADVRFVYQPVEDLYVLLVTNKASNIVQDLNTLSLIVRLITSLSSSVSEQAILHHSFELLSSFDEVVSLGYKENASLQQIRNVLEGESHEEKIQEIISRNKEAEAKEELKRRAKQLEMQRREQQRSGQNNSSRYMSNDTDYSRPPMAPSAPVVRQVPQDHERESRPSSQSKPVFKGPGMKLGKKAKQSEFFDAMGGETVDSAPAPQIQQPESSQAQTGAPVSRPAPTFASGEKVGIRIQEIIDLSVSRDGELLSLDVKGDMNLKIQDPAYGKVKLKLSDPSGPLDREIQFQHHPNVAKFTPASAQRVVSLKDPSRSFPVGQGLGVLRWRLSAKDRSLIPLHVTCWPTENNDGTMTISIEYELARPELVLEDVTIRIPISNGSAENFSSSAGSYSKSESEVEWSLHTIDDGQSTGNLEFTSVDPSVFPINVSFTAKDSICGVKVDAVLDEEDNEVEADIETELSTRGYTIV